ncbi:hypothetical protein FZEAL_65 [Fusarium zealandicum]|uniref:Uncharacterized protein n=1 Tax=Fusarium zealandicum TaxID=1053134 RepID=A0A8H4XR99_9HYPO|nr:hypothetical protein FZEAL_65 [Fusarium zealandicum]
MAATYKQFLAAPSASLLADNAALHYVTTTTTFAGPTQIIKHISALQRQVTKKKEDVFNIIDGQNVVVFEVDTGLGFQTSGGPYLPGLDDNFLSARDVYLPITHFVSFDEAGKITQIRLQWDQGSLLKQIEVIGKSGRNWPIRDSREQIAFIRSSIKAGGTAAPSAPSHNETSRQTRGSSNNAMRDPHASLHLFASREEIEAAQPASVVSPYGGNRPRQRSFTEILGDEPASPSAGRQQMSPSKAGQGKNIQPMRIFDGCEHTQEPEPPKSTNSRYIRPNPTKYSHFEFADGTDPQDAPQPGLSFDERVKSKHDSQWDFADFMTPQKTNPSRTMRTQDVRHWDTDKDAAGGETPEHAAAKPRRDAESHFELLDDGERVPQPQRPGAKPKGFTHNEGLGLYKNQLFDKQEAGLGDRALGNITNIKDRGKDFDHHFDIADKSPAHPQHPEHISEGRMKAVKMMDHNWNTYEKSPVSQKENHPVEDQPGDGNRIHIAGDGMGGRKGTNRDWLYGETQDDSQTVPSRKPNVAPSGVPLAKNAKIHIAGDGMGGKKGTDRDWLYNEAQENTSQSVPTRKQGPSAAPNDENKNAKIHIAGDGMGGKKGTDRDWLYNETQENASQSVPTRKQGTNAAPNNENKNTKIHIAGDGMGGRKGTDRDWLYGEVNEQSLPTRQQGATSSKKDFWDF